MHACTTLLGPGHESATIAYLITWSIVRPPAVSSAPTSTTVASDVWQQKMEKAYFQRHNVMHMIHKTVLTCEHDCTKDFDTQFRQLPEVVAYDTYFVDPQYWRDLFLDEDIFDQNN